MATAKNELKAQRIATEYAYRKRIHEFEMQEKELVWQRERVRFLLLYISNFFRVATHSGNSGKLREFSSRRKS